ncbi:MAG TPA: glycosyltransferase family 39 protein, partial [Solirubrobacteraceae bacterium]
MVLSLVLALSLCLRLLELDQPCSTPCKLSSPHALIFDENYYVNAARVIDGINPPKGAPYHGAPRGDDPNAEHPQLAKLVIAGGIRLFGDGPWGWRVGSVLFGLIAMVALYGLVRASGGSQWLGVGVVGVMGSDNLLLVHGRIGTLDIYAVSLMLVAAWFYMRGWHLGAGVVLGVAGCMKEVALLLLVVLVVFEGLRVARARWVRGSAVGWPRFAARPLLIAIVGSVLCFLGLLWLLDVLVPAYDPVHHVTYAGSPFTHLFHIYEYAQHLTAKPNETGITSTPWQWLLDQKVIEYGRLARNTVRDGKVISTHTLASFKGEINPFIIFVAVPALFTGVLAAWRDSDELAMIGVCWLLGTFPIFALESLLSGRISYIYYMVIVMPGIYILTTRMFTKT